VRRAETRRRGTGGVSRRESKPCWRLPRQATATSRTTLPRSSLSFSTLQTQPPAARATSWTTAHSSVRAQPVLRARFRPTAERSSLQGFPSRGRTDALPSRRGRFAPSGPCKAAAATGAYSNGACTDSANGLSTTYGEAPAPPSSLSMSERLTCVHTQKHTHSPVHIPTSPTSSLAQWHVLPFAPHLWLCPASTLARSCPQRIATALAAARAIHRTVGSRSWFTLLLHSTERTPSGLDQIYHSCVQSQQLNPARPCTTQSPQLHRQSFCCHRCIPTRRGASIAA
jgi:hypothetical protein